MPSLPPFALVLALGALTILGLAPALAGEAGWAPIDPIANDEAAAQLGRRAQLLVTVGPNGELRAAARGQSSESIEPPIKAEDPAIQAVLAMLGLERPTRFAIVGVQNPRCVRICELIGGDYLCRKQCS